MPFTCMYSHFSFKLLIALTVENKEIARVGCCRFSVCFKSGFYTSTCRWHVGSLSVRKSSEIIVENVFFGSLVLQASEQQIGVFILNMVVLKLILIIFPYVIVEVVQN